MVFTKLKRKTKMMGASRLKISSISERFPRMPKKVAAIKRLEPMTLIVATKWGYPFFLVSVFFDSHLKQKFLEGKPTWLLRGSGPLGSHDFLRFETEIYLQFLDDFLAKQPRQKFLAKLLGSMEKENGVISWSVRMGQQKGRFPGAVGGKIHWKLMGFFEVLLRCGGGWLENSQQKSNQSIKN